MIPFPFQDGQLGFEGGAAPYVAPTLADLQSIFVGSNGGLYDLTDPSTLWANTSRTTPASVNGVVQAISDISGNGNHISTASSTALLRSGGTTQSGYYVECLGTGAGWISAISNIPSTAGFSAFGSGQPTNFTTIRTLIGCDLGPSGRVMGDFCFSETSAPNPGAARMLYFLNNTSSFSLLRETTTRSAGVKYVMAGTATTTGGALYLDGTNVFNGSSSSTYTSRNSSIQVGGSTGGGATATTNLFLGSLFCAGFIAKPLTTTDRQKFEQYFRIRAGT